jgi:DNA-binding beta-propeller fold protein YncE
VPKPVSDITSMEQDTVAVASAFSDDIYVINVKTMTLTKTIKISTTLYSLQYVEGEFITACKGTLTWLSAKGLRLRENKTSVGAVFVRCFSKNSYICGDGGNAISYTKDKRKQFIYSSPTLSISRGIDVDVEGNVYCVGLF